MAKKHDFEGERLLDEYSKEFESFWKAAKDQWGAKNLSIKFIRWIWVNGLSTGLKLTEKDKIENILSVLPKKAQDILRAKMYIR